MDSWERFNETSLPPKKDFYSELTLEGVSDKDYDWKTILSAKVILKKMAHKII